MMPTNTQLFFEWADPLCADLREARSRIIITALSLHPPRTSADKPIFRLWQALSEATGKQVQVDFILPLPSKAHPATMQNMSAAQKLHDLGAHCHFAPADRLLHAKTVAIDNQIVWIGSGNWTAAASAYNHECYIRADTRALAIRLREKWIEAGFLKE